jgi:hypothetical protein
MTCIGEWLKSFSPVRRYLITGCTEVAKIYAQGKNINYTRERLRFLFPGG